MDFLHAAVSVLSQRLCGNFHLLFAKCNSIFKNIFYSLRRHIRIIFPVIYLFESGS